MQKIETVIFDLGGVLIDWNPEYVFKQVFDTQKELDYFLKEVCCGAWNAEQDRGRLFSEAIAMKVEQFPEYTDQIPLYFSRWTEMIRGEIPETVLILKELFNARNVRLYALTNWSAETFPYAWHTFPFLKYFEGILVSGKENLIKPDPAIYELMLRRFDINPTASVFIDDSIKNTSAAEQLGINVIHFSSPTKLRRSLQEYGVLLKNKLT